MVAAFAVIVGFSYGFYEEDTKDVLERECAHMRAGLDAWGSDFFDTVSEDGPRVTWISKNGDVLYDSESLENPENQGKYKEVKEALLNGNGSAERKSESAVPTFYYAMRTADGDVIRVSAPYDKIWEIVGEVVVPLFLLLIMAMAAAFLVSRAVARRIVKPINEFDLDSPDVNMIYPELRPMAEKIRIQNYSISRQLSELKMRENEFKLLTNNMSEGMILINARGGVLLVNRSARRTFGIGSEIPKTVMGIRDTESFRAAVSSALGGKTGFDSFRTENEKFYHITVTPVLHEGFVEGAVIVIIDETEKEARETLRREFTSNVSHELKTPLTSISGFAELINTGMADGEDAKRFAGNIHKEAKRLITLVGDIIRLTQLDGGEIPYDGSVDLYSVATNVADRLANIAESANVTLTVSGEHAMAEGNITILEEMIFNLCDNAIKYNRPGGYVRVNVSFGEDGAVISVSDNGIGIPEDKQDRVFERFYRVDKSHSREIGGTGLGLSIVKHAAAYHRASIALESEEGVGTTVTVTFGEATAESE